MQVLLVILGLSIAGAALAAFIWSIAYPTRRIWPPNRYTAVTPILVWVPTFALFGSLFVLGIWGWGSLDLPNWLRFGVGIPFILAGNIVVWSEVSHFGVPQTGGAIGSLRTAGMYRYSRNPQYMADIAIVSGWMVLSAAPWTLVVAIAAIVVLVAAPFAEEPWLEEQYGQAFDAYRARVRRFL
ncbi:protein-S-isoprenylcysteine O-methyltransferase Ste14 [Loktanella sp. PT4BL]|jgi:protein-S-isoprenylcysteine O-methyltransferase Ste14|uniref:methyltransferase family protein n=1 Tax=Loktanella sp. PT4BL TaxID=2135611 RepID=UPI000D76A547|nr:PEMT/PEM2 methyltransferase family protein [Loktanella sp. PT4BL]PXW67178.1 protein-S-isoprenylcysteine O-methyltransferase Ste14 [Loktanella sp. PT4BL]